MDFKRKLITLLLVISVFCILISGCATVIPDDDDDGYDYDSNIVSYIRVSPSFCLLYTSPSPRD